MNTLQKTKQIMSRFDIVASKRFGQNFLIDDNTLTSIVEAADICEDDIVIEIGPGIGNLTEYLLEKAGYSILIEVDKKLINVLEDRFKRYNNYTLLNEDVLKVDLDKLVERVEDEKSRTYKNVKVVANLPYYITTPIIFKLMEESERISSITVMVQKEVADRMVALPKSKDYGVLSVMVQYLSDANIKLVVPNSSFIPAPNVTSAVVFMKKVKKYVANDEEIFKKLVHGAFAQRRKKMINSLQSTGFLGMSKQQIISVLDKLNLNENARAEEVSTKQFIKLSNEFCNLENEVTL